MRARNLGTLFNGTTFGAGVSGVAAMSAGPIPAGAGLDAVLWRFVRVRFPCL